MTTWLLKTEPSTYSFADLQREKRTRWEGVKNAAALINLRKMAVGDQVFIYHTGSE
ncbi:MAG: EVE domain-containing protein, partial [Gemmatimonadales bacterium]